MAIWIDDNCYLDNCDDFKLYEYLYHLLYMIAQGHKYFKDTALYDNYALQGASKLFLRIKDPRQFGDNPSLSKIKSILNYIKTVSYPYKVDFEQSNYGETNQDSFIIHSDISTISNYISEESDIFDRIDFQISLSSIDSSIKNYLSKLIYSSNPVLQKNIYISCILTLLNSITLDKKYTDKIDADLLVDILFKQSRKRNVILYHLPATMSNYIEVILRELEHTLAADLSFKSSQHISAELTIKNLLAENLGD